MGFLSERYVLWCTWLTVLLRLTEKNIFSVLVLTVLSFHLMQLDGFVLPPFESTCILEDKDVVRFLFVFKFDSHGLSVSRVD